MFGTIVVTFVITALAMLALFLLDAGQHKDTENQRLRRENDTILKRVTDCYNREQEARERDAYNQGLYNGRETDALYRGFLAKCEAGEQATVILHGNENKKAS